MANGLLSNSNGSNTDILTVTVFGGVNHDSTLSGNGTSGSPLGVVNPDDTEVNSYVHNNSATIDDINEVVQSNSAQWSTEFDPTFMSGAIDNKLDSSSFVPSDFYPMTGNPSGFLTEHQSLAGYATEQWVEDKGYITGVDLTPYQEKSGMVDYQTTAGMTAYATTSDVANKLDTTAFSNVSGTFLTSINIPESANWNETTSVVESNSAAWGNEFDPSYMSGAIDNKLNTSSFADVSGTFLTAHQSLDGYATTAWVEEQGYLTAHQDISNKLDVSSFADLSGSFLTAINIPESASWNEATTAYQNASGSYLTAISIPESSTWNDVASTYQTNSSTYLTAHQSLADYATTSELNSISSYFSGAIDYVSANAGGSTSGFVSGENLVFPTAGYDTYLSAVISGDVKVIEGWYHQGEYIPLQTTSLTALGAAYNELKQSYDALSSLFATYSGQWLLPNEFVQTYVLSSTTALVELNDGSWAHGGDFGMKLPVEVSAFTEGLSQGALTAIFTSYREGLNKNENIRFGYSKYNIPDDDFCGTWASYGSNEITAVISGFGANSAAPTGYPVYMGFPYLFREEVGSLTSTVVSFSGYVPA